MRYTAESVKEYLKNYHIYCGKIACKTANKQIELAMERLRFSIYYLKNSDMDLIESYYIRKRESISDIAKDCCCSKNNIAKKLNRIIEKLAQTMSDDEPTEIIGSEVGSPKYTEKQIRGYLKRLKYFTKMRYSGIKMADNYSKDMELLYNAVQSLDDIDRQLVLELYENKEKLSVIGNTYGYSVSGVKYRIGVAIEKICAMLNGDVRKILQ